MGTEQAEPYRLSAPQTTQLSQPVWTRHRDPCSCCVYELLQPLVHRNVQIDILLWAMGAAVLDPCVGETVFLGMCGFISGYAAALVPTRSTHIRADCPS